MKFSNNLTDAELERLAYLAEECGEVQQIIGKIIRHGYESYHPHDSQKTTNRMLLTKELTNVLQAMTRLKANGDQPGLVINKINYYNNAYWHHQPEVNYEECHGCQLTYPTTNLHLGADDKKYCSVCLSQIYD